MARSSGVVRSRVEAARGAGDAGYVAVFVALCLPLLVGMCALAIDVAYWHSEGATLQKSADDAALAGVVYLPSNIGKAVTTATQNAKANGIVVDADTTLTIAQVPERPTRLRVTISQRVDNFFGVIFGKPSTVVTRTSVADFAGPAPMGSPCNLFGNELMESAGDRVASSSCDNSFGTYWINVAGPNVNIARGDAYAASWCGAPDGTSIDGCSGVSSTFASNPNFTPKGYVYVIRNRASGQIDPQAYDAGWAAQDDHCELVPAAAATSTNAFVPTAPDAAQRYKHGTATAVPASCSGDTRQTGADQGDGSTVTTVFTVRGKSPNPFDPLQGPVLCTKTYNGWNSNGADPYAALADMLKGPNPPNLQYDATLASEFHRWSSLCAAPVTVTLGAGDDYVDYSVQIQTYQGTAVGGGQNRMGLRVTSTAGNGNVSFFAAGRASLYINTPLGKSKLNLVRLDSSAANHVLKIRLWDFGDLSNAQVNVTVNRPDSSTLSSDGNQPLDGCVGQGPDTSQNGTLSNCTVKNMRAGVFGGHWQTISIPIPSTYRCNASTSDSKCWVTLGLDITATGPNPSSADTTTISAILEGDPVRLVE